MKTSRAFFGSSGLLPGLCAESLLAQNKNRSTSRKLGRLLSRAKVLEAADESFADVG